MSPSFDALWPELEPIGRDPRTGGYNRPAWGRVDAELRAWFAGACFARGFDVTTDRAGNLCDLATQNYVERPTPSYLLSSDTASGHLV